MEKESFEDHEIAEALNRNFISIKVDRELRPDIDSIYMSVCQAMTGSGGWPMSIFLTPEQQPFFAGTYFPKLAAYGQIGFLDLLLLISRKWQEEKEVIIDSAEKTLAIFQLEETGDFIPKEKLLEKAFLNLQYSFDKRNGGFGNAPKFPAAHNLLFLLEYHRILKNEIALEMVEKTLIQLFKGGIFDHIGGGFSRYSTDEYFLVPHFEKMLYDNALLMMAYAQAFQLRKKEIYRLGAERTAAYILREMTGAAGGIYSAMDADSEGEEGKFYTFTVDETLQVLGKEDGEKFNRFYGITRAGNFENKNIPNLLHHKGEVEVDAFEETLRKLYEYRKQRTTLHLDDKILTSWNALLIGSFAMLYQVFGKEEYLQAAKKAAEFIRNELSDKGNAENKESPQVESPPHMGSAESDTLYVGYRDGSKMQKGFLDEYAYAAFAFIRLYDATLETSYLEQANLFLEKAIRDFADEKNGGFFLTGKDNETLINRPKEIYDGAIPSGNSVMAYNLVRMAGLYGEESKEFYEKEAGKQLDFMKSRAVAYPTGHSFFLLALLLDTYPPEHVVCVVKDSTDLEQLKKSRGLHANILVLKEPTKEYPLINEKTTYYVCKDFSCLPPSNRYKDY